MSPKSRGIIAMAYRIELEGYVERFRTEVTGEEMDPNAMRTAMQIWVLRKKVKAWT